MAGSSNSVTSRSLVEIGKGDESKRIEKIIIDWVADDAAATVPDLSIPLNGYLLKVITNPGATAPTANYDITLEDPEDNALDAAGGLLANRAAATTEQVYPNVSGATIPIFLMGTYNVAVSNNAVNSATGRIILYLASEL